MPIPGSLSMYGVPMRCRDISGANPTAEKYLEAGQNLSADEIRVLVDNHVSHYILDDGQEKELTYQVGQNISTTDGQKAIEDAVKQALKSAGQIDYIFKYTLDLLQQVEKQKKYHRQIFQRFYWASILTEHLFTALDALIKFEYCNSDYHSAQDTKDVITKLMKAVEQIEKDQQDMRDKFDEFQKSFSTFSGSFHDWAKDAIEEKQKQIQTLRDAITDLQKQIDDMTQALYIIGGDAVLIVFGTAVCAGDRWAMGALGRGNDVHLTCPQIAGLIFVGAEFATVFGLVCAVVAKKKEIDDKQNEVNDLNSQINRISETDENIKSTWNLQGQFLALHLANLTRVWDMGKSEAEEVYKWLGKPAKPDEKPDMLKQYTKRATMHVSLAHIQNRQSS
ncbi:hypothetical protein BO83DRAFT_425906 [Aspergillus eucalypticola CBS 122712]|uniref:Uncharacterized protein n=1 Tax=Aspergillus eucalypticola (strain CBS 122712 / IBT 29274) TaxID=1448314 RepID=A0A317VRT9_ASPEC|nr:uncharacterized protein BO83DRAFT_425906 [Aspergillus eucalypticola CBS 122712]PWY75612.1 hypothetical protein BO83DRAFT_425906 [Aspergillus eucalypticola CBS 122712]